MNGKVILLTGAPATGKSSLSQELQSRVPNFETIDYGKWLLKKKQKIIPELTYEHLRQQSSALITAEDVENIDRELVQWVNIRRTETHVLIDTHCVTKEVYGFRMIPFQYAKVLDLRLDAVISLYCDPEIVQNRIRHKPDGRPQITQAEALKHSQLQDGAAGLYGVVCGCPVYYLDSSGPVDNLCRTVIDLLELDSQGSVTFPATIKTFPP